MNNSENGFQGTTENPLEKRVWKYEEIPIAMDMIKREKLILLGGDLLTADMHYTGEGWYYNPQKLADNIFESIERNSERSICVAREYIDRYTSQTGTDYFFVLVFNKGLEVMLKKGL